MALDNVKKDWTPPKVTKYSSAGQGAGKTAAAGQSVIRTGPPCGIRDGHQCYLRNGPSCTPARFSTSCVARLGAPCGMPIPEEPTPPF